MAAGNSKGAVTITWGAEHREGDRLIVKMCAVESPAPLTCLKVKCIIGFMGDCLRSALIQMYHQRRIAYAEKNRNKNILARYRTGEHSPQTILMAIIANIKLTCPVCRKYETKYW